MTSVPERLRQLLPEIDSGYRLGLQIGPLKVTVASNSRRVHEELAQYFRTRVTEPSDEGLLIRALESDPIEFGVELRDWTREPDRRRKKDAFADVPGGRLVRKVRTDMQFFFSTDVHWCIGPCEAHINQVIDFINQQMINDHLSRGSVLCHAAALTDHGGLAISARAGGGKSTLCLDLMRRGWSFVSNDRLLVRREPSGTTMTGVPKYPRVNPGTLLNNPALAGILPEERRAALSQLAPAELWDLEEKYDVDVTTLFGADRWQLDAPLRSLLVLNWHRADSSATRIRPLEPGRATELFQHVAKSPGPFFIANDGRRLSGYQPPALPPYFDAFSDVQVFEASGKANFAYAADWLMEALG